MRLVVVRKKNCNTFTLPGGKKEHGETDEETLKRELLEELGVQVTRSVFFGTFNDIAFIENKLATFNVYEVNIIGEISSNSEISQVKMIDSNFVFDSLEYGSIIKKHVMPKLIELSKVI